MENLDQDLKDIKYMLDCWYSTMTTRERKLISIHRLARMEAITQKWRAAENEKQGRNSV